MAAAQACINATEAAANNFSSMCEIVAEQYNRTQQVKISGPIVRLRILSGDLKTSLSPKPRKARTKKMVLAKEKKYSVVPTDAEGMLKLHKGKEKWVIAALKGSRKGAIFAKCFDCCCGQSIEIKMCQNSDCSLHSFRPYK